MLDRRELMKRAGVAALATGFASTRALADTVTLPFDNGERPVVSYPQKRPMIGLTQRPPQLETPFAVFNEPDVKRRGELDEVTWEKMVRQMKGAGE